MSRHEKVWHGLHENNLKSKWKESVCSTSTIMFVHAFAISPCCFLCDSGDILTYLRIQADICTTCELQPSQWKDSSWQAFQASIEWLWETIPKQAFMMYLMVNLLCGLWPHPFLMVKRNQKRHDLKCFGGQTHWCQQLTSVQMVDIDSLQRLLGRQGYS